MTNFFNKTILFTATLLTTALAGGCGPGQIEDEVGSAQTETGSDEVKRNLLCTGYACLWNMDVQQALNHFTKEELEAFAQESQNGTLEGKCEEPLEYYACLLDFKAQGLVSLHEDSLARAEDFSPFTCAICKNRVEELTPPIFPLADPYPEGIGGACGLPNAVIDGHPDLLVTYMTSDPNEFFMPIGGPNPYCSFESGSVPTGDHLFEEEFNFGGKVCTGLTKGCSWMCSSNHHCQSLMGEYAFGMGITPFCGVGHLDSQGIPALCGLQ